MGFRNTDTNYGSVSKFIHWFIFFIVIAMLILGFIMDDFHNTVIKGLAYNTHKLIGMLVLIIMIIRLLWKLSNPNPELKNYIKPWEYQIQQGVMALLYILLIALPLTGWIMSTAAQKYVNFFGLFNIPFPGIPLNRPLAKSLGLAHELIAYWLIALISLHFLAALKHQFINKDNILRRMLPGR